MSSSKPAPAAGPDGVLLVDKDPGFTSHNAVALCRRILQTRKVGHCGTLDPMATGLLLVVIGKATKLQDSLMSADKEYTATMKLGIETDTQDADGRITATHPIDTLSESDIRAAFEHYRGEFDQTPPMYSAARRTKLGGMQTEATPYFMPSSQISFICSQTASCFSRV